MTVRYRLLAFASVALIGAFILFIGMQAEPGQAGGSEAVGSEAGGGEAAPVARTPAREPRGKAVLRVQAVPRFGQSLKLTWSPLRDCRDAVR